MTNPHGTPIWYELLTADPGGSKAFYDAVIGWSVEPQPAGEMDYRMIDTGTGRVGGVMRLSLEMESGGAKPGWLIYVGVDDVDIAVAQALAHGGAVHMSAITLPGIGRMALLADPHGAPFYAMRGDSDEASTAFQQGERATPGHAVWNELTSPDQDAAMAFYAALFGWRHEGAMPMGDLGDYKFVLAGSVAIGASMGRMPGGRDGWLPYFLVPDIDTAVDRLRSAHGILLQGPIEIPGGSFSAVAQDPHGARFGFVGARHGGDAA